MTAPDLPMRERIAEALAKHDLSWQGGDHPTDYLHLECRCGIAWGEEAEWSDGLAHQADAVFAVLADLPDTAVEAGAEALEAHTPADFHEDEKEMCCRECGEAFDWMPMDYQRFEARKRAHRMRAALAAAIAAIKEGKA